MNNALAQRTANLTRSWLLIAGFCVIVIAIGYALAQAYGNASILAFAVLFSLITTGISYFFSDRIALSSSGAKEVTQAQQPALYATVQKLATAAQIPMPRLYLTEERQINAFATGRNPQHAAVAVTRGALEKLTPAELEAVLAHELSHVTNRDILVSSIAVVLAGVIAMGSQYLGNSMFSRRSDREGGQLGLILGLVLIILAPIGATLMQLAVSRRRESLADASGAILTKRPGDLADALTKIGADAAPMLAASDATAHLWISNPFKGKEALGFIHRLFMTHPPIEARVAALRAMQEGK